MMRSPWTVDLCRLLKAALEDVDEQDTFDVVLKERLKNHGTELLNQVGIKNPCSLPEIDG